MGLFKDMVETFSPIYWIKQIISTIFGYIILVIILIIVIVVIVKKSKSKEGFKKIKN